LAEHMRIFLLLFRSYVIASLCRGTQVSLVLRRQKSEEGSFILALGDACSGEGKAIESGRLNIYTIQGRPSAVA